MNVRLPIRRIAPWLAAFALAFVAAPAAAQDVGKIEGRIVDATTGEPVAGAQVLVVGTTLGNLTGPDGYYFVNNVPAGLHNVRAQFIGYRTVNITQQRVLAGQTTRIDFRLDQTAVEVEPLEIVGERQPLVPRDQVGSKAIIAGETVDRLPVDNIRSVITLQPGVVDSDRAKGVSIRGGRAGEEAVYVDGILIRNYNEGSSRTGFATNAVSEVDVLTGGFGAEFGEAQSGIINFVSRTPAGGPPGWSGVVNTQTDALAPKDWSVGLNRFEASAGGPILGGLSFFGAFTAQGQMSANTGREWKDVPIYVMDGIDTVVTVEAQSGSTGQTDFREVAIPNFVEYDEGGRYPYSNRDQYTVSGKLDYTFGIGSRVSLRAGTSRNQIRRPPINNLFNPQGYSGTLARTHSVILGWTQNFVQRANQALALDVKFAYLSEETMEGALDPTWEVDHRSPDSGFTLGDLQFLVDEDDFPVNQELVDNFLRNEGRRTPFEIGRTDVNASQEFRLNPYGVNIGFPNSGINQTETTLQGFPDAVIFDYTKETQFQLRATVDWQADRYHRAKFGGDFTKIDVKDARIQYQSQSFGDVWIEDPIRAGLFAQDRIDLGDVVIEAGLRWDMFDPRSDYPLVAGFFDPDDPSTFAEAGAESEFSPRLGVSFPVTERSTFRLNYGHYVQVPDLNEYYQGKNVDFFRFRNTNTNDIFGRPLQLAKTIAFEFGYRQLLAEDFVLDIAVYNRDKVRDVAVRKLPWDDPTNPGTVNFLNTITNADFGNVRGIDLRVDRRFGQLLDVTAGYSYQDARNTGTDPYTYTDVFARIEGNANTLLGLPPNPAQAVRPTEENRKHNLTGNFLLEFPNDFDTPWLRNLGLFGTVRLASGLPYAFVENTGTEYLIGPPTDLFTGNLRDGELSTEATPWIKQLDLKLTKGFRVSGRSAQIFLDARNVFDFQNRARVVLTTGDVVDLDLLQERARNLHMQRLGNGAVRQVDLSSLAAAEATSAGGVTNDADRIALLRAESRFGNGDGIFSPDEQEDAFLAAELFRFGPQYLIEPGRRLRFGIELSF